MPAQYPADAPVFGGLPLGPGMAEECMMTVQGEGGWKLHRARYAGDAGARQAIQSDDDLRRMIDAVNHGGAASQLREHFLSQAVRVDTGVLPDLARAFTDIHERAGIDLPLEAYVYADPSPRVGARHPRLVCPNG